MLQQRPMDWTHRLSIGGQETRVGSSSDVFHAEIAVKRKAKTCITNRENMRPPRAESAESALTWVPQPHWPLHF